MSTKRPREDSDKDELVGPSPKRQKKSNNNDTDETESKFNLSNATKSISLPINECKDEILSIINNPSNNIIIITGDTGSGKSTQLSQILYNTKLYKNIIITQPRRIGAVSLARRVSKEMNVTLGDLVGYQIRFQDYSHPLYTKIKYVTDGILLREILSIKNNQKNSNKLKYDVIILDEAHERSLQTDILFSVLRDMLKSKQYKFKLLITSATLNETKFSKFFNSAPVYHIEGRCYPVEVSHVDKEQTDYISSCIDTILNIHFNEDNGHILCFLTGQEEIERACTLCGDKIDEIINESSDDPSYDCVILPAYGSLSYEKQQRIFANVPDNCRKIIFATNIAETSLTINDIKYVIDPGLIKQKQYNFETGIDELIINNISQKSAVQRKGRCGRTGKGKCYRLYTKKELSEFNEETIPEILRSNLCSTILLLKIMGITDVIHNFEFVDKPDKYAFINALNKLYLLGVIDKKGNLEKNKKIGHKMAKFPLDPIYSKILIESIEYEAMDIALNLVSIITANNGNSGDIFIKNKDVNHKQFYSKYGDIISWLLCFNYFMQNNDKSNDNGYKWCKDNFVNFRILKNALKIRQQLKQIIDKEFDRDLLSKQGTTKPIKSLRKVLAKSLFMQSALKMERDRTRNTNDRNYNRNNYNAFRLYGESEYRDNVYIHPSTMSILNNKSNDDELKWIIYLEIVFTSKPYMRGICSVKYEWIKKLLPKTQHKIKWIKDEDNDPVHDKKVKEKDEKEIETKKKVIEHKIDINSVRERYLKRKMLKNKLNSL